MMWQASPFCQNSISATQNASQYLVWPPRACMHAWQRRGMLLMRRRMVSCGMSSQICLRASVDTDPFTSITGAQGEPALICEKHRAPVADMPILVFYSKCQSSSTVLGSEHRAHYRTSRPEATLMKSVSDCLGRDIHSSGLLEVIL